MLQSKPGSGTQGKQLKEQSKIEPSSRPEVIERADVVVAGALAVDFSCDYTPLSKDDSASPTLHTSNPSSISQSFGGVGHNVALAASYAGSKVLFCSAVANDLVGRAAMEALDSNGISGHGVLQLDPMATGARTAQYIAVNDTKKDLLVAMADMSIMELPDYKLDFEGTWKPLILQSRPSWAVVDANWSPRALSKWIALCKDSGISVAIEPVSVPKSRRLFSREAPVLSASRIVPNHVIDLATPNQHELAAMHAAAREAELFDSPEWWQLVDALNLPSVGSRDRFIHLTSVKMVDEGIPQQSIQMLPFIPCIITKLGPQGVLLTQLLSPDDPRLTSPDSAPYILTRSMASDTPVGGVYMRLFRPAETIPDGEIMSVNGAGDALLGTIVSALATGVDRGTNRLGKIVDILGIAQKASIMTLRHQGGVSPEITKLARSLQAL
jgi:sugar/nucleoside kinase (ribokinase family)